MSSSTVWDTMFGILLVCLALLFAVQQYFPCSQKNVSVDSSVLSVQEHREECEQCVFVGEHYPGKWINVSVNRTDTQIVTTFIHEYCHHLVSDDYNHFCWRNRTN